MLERTIEADGVRRLKQFGAYALKMVVLSWRGWPDRLVLAPGGHIFFIEFKRADAKPRANQRAIHTLIRRLGFRIYVISSVAGTNRMLDREFLKRGRK